MPRRRLEQRGLYKAHSLLVRGLLCPKRCWKHPRSAIPEVRFLQAWAFAKKVLCVFLNLLFIFVGRQAFFLKRFVAPAPAEVEATSSLNNFLRGLYHEGLFISSGTAGRLAREGLCFLRLYAELAMLSYQRSAKRFPLVPKGHYMHHQCLDLLRQSQKSQWCVSPLLFACQCQEDYVGRPSRLSRRVNPRTTSLRVLQRSFLAMRGAVLGAVGAASGVDGKRPQMSCGGLLGTKISSIHVKPVMGP